MLVSGVSKHILRGYIVCLREEPLAPTGWSKAKFINFHPGQDGKVRVVTIIGLVDELELVVHYKPVR